MFSGLRWALLIVPVPGFFVLVAPFVDYAFLLGTCVTSVKDRVGNNVPKYKPIVPTLCARRYTPVCFRGVIPAWMPVSSAMDGTW